MRSNSLLIKLREAYSSICPKSCIQFSFLKFSISGSLSRASSSYSNPNFPKSDFKFEYFSWHSTCASQDLQSSSKVYFSRSRKAPSALKSALHLCKPIWNAVKENCEIILSPRTSAEFSQNEIEYSVEKFTDADRKYVYEMIRRHLNKELATDYMKGRRGAHVGEFESIALAKRLKIPVVIHDNRGRQWAKWEGAKLNASHRVARHISQKIASRRDT